MPLFEIVIALLLAGAILSAWARRISVPYPALLALAGAGLALLPRVPREMDDLPGYAEALRRASEAERRKLIELRAKGVIGDDAFHRVEEELDWADLHAEAQRSIV